MTLQGFPFFLCWLVLAREMTPDTAPQAQELHVFKCAARRPKRQSHNASAFAQEKPPSPRGAHQRMDTARAIRGSQTSSNMSSVRLNAHCGHERSRRLNRCRRNILRVANCGGRENSPGQEGKGVLALHRVLGGCDLTDPAQEMRGDPSPLPMQILQDKYHQRTSFACHCPGVEH